MKTSEEVKEKFNGKTFRYLGKEYMVTDTKVDSATAKIIISTTTRTFVFMASEYDDFVKRITLSNCEKPMKAQNYKIVPAVPAVLQEQPEYNKLENGLMAMFEKLEGGDVECLNSAKQMVDIANTMCSIQRTKLETVKMLKG